MDSEKVRVVRERLADYERSDAVAQRDKLVAFWRAAHPEAVLEASVALHPLVLLKRRDPSAMRDLPDEEWINDVYAVTLRRRPDHVFGTRQGMIQLGISALAGTARHDWREFQAIKNQLAGPECEAFELYPAESRLLDPSNYYALWCFPGLKRIKVGIEVRDVKDADEALAPQRALAREG